MFRKILLSISLLLAVGQMMAQDAAEAVRPVTSVLQLQVGESKAHDTYLTPQLYTGTALSLGYERWHAWKLPQWVSQQTLMARFGLADDRGGHTSEMVGRFSYRYAAHYRWDHFLYEPLTVMAGAFTGMEFGFDYNLTMAGANNPATAKAAFNMGASAAAVWHYTLRQRSCSAMLHVQLPLLGYALQPEYGASYYETFYLGSAMSAFNFTSLHNRQDLDVRLTTDMAASLLPWHRNSANSVRLGVAYHIETMDVNKVVTRFSTFDFVVGIVFEYMKYNRQKTNLLNRQAYEAY